MGNELDRLEVKRLAEPAPLQVVTFFHMFVTTEVAGEEYQAYWDRLTGDDLKIIFQYLKEMEREGDLLAPLRCYHRELLKSDQVRFGPGSPLSDFLIAELGWKIPSPEEITKLTVGLISLLMKFTYRLRHACTEPARQEVLRDIAATRAKAATFDPDERSLVDDFVKALETFPRPTPDSAPGNSSPPVHEERAAVPRSISDHLDYLGWGKSWGLKKLRQLEGAGAIKLEESQGSGLVSLWRMRVLNANIAYNRKRIAEP